MLPKGMAIFAKKGLPHFGKRALFKQKLMKKTSLCLWRKMNLEGNKAKRKGMTAIAFVASRSVNLTP
jgi:hypothetical protein